MRVVIIRSLAFGLVAAGANYLSRTYLHTDLFLTDVSGLSAFLSVFGTLYGILAAFVVFEVWSQYNHVSELIDKESQGLERLYRLTLYFRDDKLTAQVKNAIAEYANIIIQGKFGKLAAGLRNVDHGLAFRKIADIIRHVEFDDDHDSIVFEQIVEHYGNLGQIRTERLNHDPVASPLEIFHLHRFILRLSHIHLHAIFKPILRIAFRVHYRLPTSHDLPDHRGPGQSLRWPLEPDTGTLCPSSQTH
jgi:hypothetical protein